MPLRRRRRRVLAIAGSSLARKTRTTPSRGQRRTCPVAYGAALRASRRTTSLPPATRATATRPDGRWPTRSAQPRCSRRSISIRLLISAVLMPDPIRQEQLDERLVRHVVSIREHLEILEHRFGQPERDGSHGRLELRECDAPGSTPIEILGRVVFRPELTFCLLALERGDLLHVRSKDLLSESLISRAEMTLMSSPRIVNASNKRRPAFVLPSTKYRSSVPE